MKFATLIWSKIKLNFSLDLNFLSFKRLPLGKRLYYILQKYMALTTGRRKIPFLGVIFSYDNHWTPTLLQQYPSELEILTRIIDISKIHTVLDVGANIGQFSVTWQFYNPNSKIYAFEPNTHIFQILRKNVRDSQTCKTYPYAIGSKPGIIDFFFVANKSAQGSFFTKNASHNLLTNMVTKTSAEVIILDDQTCKKHGIPTKFDLIKIDTEGAEEQVLLGLSSIQWRYLYIECSLNRAGAISESRLWELVSKEGKASPKLIFKSPSSPDLATFDVIIENLAFNSP